MKELVGLILTCGQLSFGERKLSWLDSLHYFYINDVWIYVSNEISPNTMDSPDLKICNIWLGRALMCF